MLPKLKPLAVKERLSLLFLGRGQLDVQDGAFVLVDCEGVRTHIPVGGVACLMLEPGTRVSHAAVVLAARAGTLLVWTGEAGVRVYSAGQPGGARSDRLLYQAQLALEPAARLKVVRRMFAFRFGEEPPEKRSVEQLRGIEGTRVRAIYAQLAKSFGVAWNRRDYDPHEWGAGDVVNRCLSSATACLYGVSEAAILAAGYAPAIGFLHTGKPRSFVYDIADLFKFETVVPVAFRVASRNSSDPEGEVRRACRDAFRKTKLLHKIIPTIEDVLAAGEIPVPEPPEDAVGPAFSDEEGIGDAGHRN
ncbi:CRISPR-associated protein Cas1 [Desulfobaculum xiamenense]|uniref:CRISPR-associated endonuclease Cas1 n=1 Tax=Desulfobaculum xiamenense TaxID=995050 RepID=A0A846QRU2_9BACT|nr:type I-E CRISPR-associated endonuclease Cas1e [Desulfobaculum xiamenense]NJB67904.1 CRISPR-associated protein Cas1 [Desulfobaculum xiamenense]